MRDELVGDLGLLGRPARAHRGLAALGDQGLVAHQELLDLQRIVGERLRRSVDAGQATTDHHDRQADLKVGDRVLLGRTGELQRHQKIRRRTYATRQAVRQVEHRGLAGAGAQRDVIEAHREGTLDRHRTAEAHATEHRELGAALQQQPHHLEVVLVPADGDAVLRHATETRHGTLAEILAEARDVLHGVEGNALAVHLHARLLLG